jgi:exopolysaccharide biosynthesis polyprenyl glycosylphosphotransferase
VPGGRAQARAATSRAGTAWRLRRWLQVRTDLVLAPLAGAVALGALSTAHRLPEAALAFAAIATGLVRARRLAPHAALLPVMHRVQPVVGPAVGVAALVAAGAIVDVPQAGPLALGAALLASVVVCAWSSTGRRTAPAIRRAAYIGGGRGAARLADALEARGSSRYALIGRIACAADDGNGAATDALGSLDDLPGLVIEHEIDVLIMGVEAPRLAVFGRMADSCLDLPVRLAELSVLFEEIFGHVPVADINAAWFQCVADPDMRAATGPLKRAVDLVGGSMLLVLAAPVIAAFALVIRRDGSRAVYRQVRIGEGGRPFRLYKLRTMRIEADVSARWAAPDDPRITRVGTFLRRTHLDELPQLVNVVRGEMSLVGPRPEQPELVDRLETMLRFYQRRHLTRPGITGWAQVRCGYGGSDTGSAWKLCHDLYYIKHRSVGLDALILGETLTLWFRREEALRPESAAYVLGEGS